MSRESPESQPANSPFHRGERELQERLGVRQRLEEQGRRVIRDSLPDQHREFFAQLPFVLLGTIDKAGRPWASLLVGQPGFISSPHPSRLRLNARPIYGDPLNENLVPDSDVGLLGIEFHSRRRNRMAGKVVTAGNGTVEIRVVQSFGNCPQYIQARDCELTPALSSVGEERQVERLSELGEAERAIITQADNFYIASQFSEDRAQASHGIDVSHRGGKPGFVRFDNNHTLTWPDFVGNFHFNTLGNILLNPHVGLLFIDFNNQDLLYLTGSAEIIWDGEELRAFTGAQRLLRFSLQAAIRVAGALPMHWRFQEYSPSLEQTGSWQEVAATLAARAEGNIYREYEVARVEKESANISSFYLEPKGEQSIPCHKAGQFLPLELHPLGIDHPPGVDIDEPLLRTYTISSAPNGSSYRLSIKREPAAKSSLPPGIASNYFHDRVTQGTTLRAMSPRGKFSLDTSSTRPIVFLSAGVGITPMISMLDQLIKQAGTCGCQRQMWFIHGARNGAEHAFAGHVRALAEICESLQVHIRYSRPTHNDQPGRDYDSQGHVDVDLLKSLLPFDDYDFYVCGPAPFIAALHSGLRSLNISDKRIHYEFFAQGSSLQRERPSGFDAQTAPADRGPVAVRFARSGVSAVWTPSKGSLLDLAEAEGLRPDYSCRSGICQTCTTKMVSGEVEYLEPPMAAPREGEVLICCSYPRPQSGGGEDDEDIILDL